MADTDDTQETQAANLAASRKNIASSPDTKISKSQAQGVGQGAFGYNGSAPSSGNGLLSASNDNGAAMHQAAVARWAAQKGLPPPSAPKAPQSLEEYENPQSPQNNPTGN
jgi:hypothetical protein